MIDVTFIFKTTPNRKPKEKKGGTWHIMSLPSKKVWVHVPRVHHLIAPMVVSVVARKDIPSCSQHVVFSPFLVDPPKASDVHFRRGRIDRTDDLAVFDLLSRHIRKESEEWLSPRASLTRSTPSNNLLQLCRIEPLSNRTNYEEENDDFTETQLLSLSIIAVNALRGRDVVHNERAVLVIYEVTC